jgi:hypothetical protein
MIYLFFMTDKGFIGCFRVLECGTWEYAGRWND